MFFAAVVAALSLTAAAPPARIVAVGGGVTESVFALGLGDRVVAVDGSSVFPAAVTTLPQVGYHRALSAEGVISQRPDVVVLTDEAGPPAAIAQLKAAGVNVVVIPEQHSIAGARAKITALAAALDVEDRAAALVARIDADLKKADAVVARNKAKAPKVLFVYSRGSSSVSVAGDDTAAAAMIALAGGRNAVVGLKRYQPLTAEAALLAAPDVIVLPARGLAASGGVDGVLALPGLKDTPAGRNRRVIGVDDLLLLGFSPRVGEGVEALAVGIEGAVTSTTSTKM